MKITQKVINVELLISAIQNNPQNIHLYATLDVYLISLEFSILET